MTTVEEVIACLRRLAPLDLAADWDNTGLLLGDTRASVGRVMTCLTVTAETADEAISNQCDLIVTHHPVLFRPTQRLTTATADGRLLLALIRAGVSVYSPHTAFDNAVGGINDLIAARLQLTGVEPLRRLPGAASYKVVVFAPESDLQPVSEALFQEGAGIIGNYEQCSFRILGTGSFFGGPGTHPSVGRKGQREYVTEWRLEVLCPAARLPQAIAAMRQAHSYEEPAFDIYPLQPSLSVGEGRIGQFDQAISLSALVSRVKSHLGVSLLQWVGRSEKDIQRLAIACGAAGEFLGDAISAGADCFLTGELRFHDCVRARSCDIAVILPGHYATERLGVEELGGLIKKQLPTLEVWASRAESDPLQMG